ncbi:MAG: hypothetical protein AAGE80_07845 [Pseudomonadota bacterium]
MADPEKRTDGVPEPVTELTNDQILNAVATLLPEEDGTRAYVLCEADRETGQCSDDLPSLKAFGLGGLLLPLVMEVRGLEFNEVSVDENGVPEFETDFDVTVNLIPPVCPDADGQFEVKEGGIVTLAHDPFYCNWVVIGNVVTQFDFAIDMLDPETQSFTGNYALQINGTGNAVGTGYFRAFPKPPASEKDDEVEEAEIAALN